MKRRMNFKGINLILSAVIIIISCIFCQSNAVAENVTLVWSTFLGGSKGEEGDAIVVDSSGCAYVIGRTAYFGFPTTAGAYDESHNGSYDAFITKLNSDGTDLVYSTFLGGGGLDYGLAIDIDSAGCAYVTGRTRSSTTFPTTAGAYDETYNGGTEDVFVTKLNSDGTDLVYSTFLGGSSYDCGYGIALDSSGSAYVTGFTSSTDFPTTAGAYDETHNGGYDVFVTKLTTDITISGTVTFQYPGWVTEHCVRTDYQVRDPGLPPAAPLYEGTLTVCLNTGDAATGSFGIIDDITDGTYDVALKHCNHVADMKTVVISGGKATGVDLTLWAGDADGDDNVSTVEATTPSDPEGDNDVDLSDYYTLYYQYVGGLPVTTRCNADFDGDGNIDLADYYGLYYGYQNAANPGNWY